MNHVQKQLIIEEKNNSMLILIEILK